MRTKLNDEIESNASGAGAGGEAEKVEGQGQVQGANPVTACEGGAEAGRQSVATFKPKGSSITLIGAGRRDGSDVNNSLSLTDFYKYMLHNKP